MAGKSHKYAGVFFFSNHLFSSRSDEVWFADGWYRENAPPIPSSSKIKGGWKEVLKGLGLGKRDLEKYERNLEEVRDAVRRGGE